MCARFLYRLIAAAIVAVQLLLPAAAAAGRITLNWTPALSFSEQDSDILVQGTIEVSNNGDETTIEVFPSLKLAGWEWAGDRREIQPEGKTSWTVEAVFPKERLSCAVDPGCGGMDLPLSGDFPLQVKMTYHDMNHYQFSAVEIRTAVIGKVDPKAAAAARVPTIVPLLTIDGAGEHFTGTLELNNISDTAHKAATFIVTASEITVSSAAGNLDLAPHSIGKKEFSLQNFSGLIGNSYRVYGVVQWENAGIRLFSQAVRMVELSPAKSSTALFGMIWALSGFSAALIIGALILVLSRRRKSSAESAGDGAI